MKSILIIDDDYGNREYLDDAVNRLGYRAVPHADGASALSLLASGEPIDAAIVALIMRGMDGLEFLVRAKQLVPDLPCIVLSGDLDMEDYLKVKQLGAVEYLHKPVRIRALGKMLLSAIKKSEAGSATGENLFQRGGDAGGTEEAPWKAA